MVAGVGYVKVASQGESANFNHDMDLLTYVGARILHFSCDWSDGKGVGFAISRPSFEEKGEGFENGKGMFGYWLEPSTLTSLSNH